MAWILDTASVRSFRVWMFRMWVRMSTDLSIPRADLLVGVSWCMPGHMLGMQGVFVCYIGSEAYRISWNM